MKRSFLVLITVLLLGVLIVTGCTAAPSTPSTTPTPTPTPTPTQAPSTQTFELKFAYWIPPVIPIAKLGYDAWGNEIENATGGRVKIKFFGGGAMGAPADHYKLCTSGTADIVNFVPEFTPGVFPLTSSYALPMMFPSSEVAAAAFWQFHQKYTTKTEMKGVKLLAVSPTAPMQLLTNKVQVKTLADLKGLKLAVTAPVQTKIVEKLGGTPVFMPEGDVYTSLERGMVDGRLHQWDGAVSWKGMEVTKYRTGDANLALDIMHIAMNLDTWNKLPADLQNIITGASGLLWSRHLGMVFDRANNTYLSVVQEYDKKKGNPDIYWLPGDERQKWIAAISPYYDEWIKDMDSKGLQGKAVVEDLKAWVAQYTKSYQ
jgi:TRAP-type C4-dicarboxylate transport system substrate-binding protein